MANYIKIDLIDEKDIWRNRIEAQRNLSPYFYGFVD